MEQDLEGIEIVDTGGQGTEKWKEFRKEHVTSTDAPKIEGVSPFGTGEDVLAEKTTDIKDNTHLKQCVQWGSAAETTALYHYCQHRNPREGEVYIVEGTAVDGPVSASPDALIGPEGSVEVKTRGHWTKSFRHLPPDYHMVQMRVMMGVCKRKWCDYVEYIPSLGIKVTRIWHDEHAWQEMRARLVTWWEICLKPMLVIHD